MPPVASQPLAAHAPVQCPLCLAAHQRSAPPAAQPDSSACPATSPSGVPVAPSEKDPAAAPDSAAVSPLLAAGIAAAAVVAVVAVAVVVVRLRGNGSTTIVEDISTGNAPKGRPQRLSSKKMSAQAWSHVEPDSPRARVVPRMAHD